MPSFLESLGRAKPITKGIEFLEERQKAKEDIESARIERGFRQRQIEAADINIASAKIGYAQKLREETEENALMPVESIFAKTPNLGDSFKQTMMQELTDGGYLTNVNGTYHISQRKKRLYEQSKKEDYEFWGNALKSQAQDITLQLDSISQELVNPDLKPDKKIGLEKNREILWKRQGDLAFATLANDAQKGVIEGKITPESFQQFMQTRDFSKLKQVGKEVTPQIQTWYEIDTKGNIRNSYTLDSNKSDDINIIKSKGLVPANDPRIREDMRKEFAGVLSEGQKVNIAHQIRTELRQDKYVQDFKDVDNKFKVMEAAYAKSKTGKEKTYVAIDQALITLYNKMTDPSSVVRESEYARTPENMSIANRVLGKIDKWRVGGAGLTADEREALVQMGREFYKSYAKNYDQIVSDYEQTAKESGIDPNLIGIPYKRKNIPTQQTGGQTLPPEAAKQLKEGIQTTFGNGQTWTLQNGQQMRIK